MNKLQSRTCFTVLNYVYYLYVNHLKKKNEHPPCIQHPRQAADYYLAIQNLRTVFPALVDEMPVPVFVRENKKHSGPVQAA